MSALTAYLPKKRKWRVVLALAGILLAAFLFFLIQRAVRIAQVRRAIAITAPGGIESLEYVEIGGIRQAVLIRGNDVSNPVLLMLHGGPGYPEIAAQRGIFLEDYYTVVNFDQRGAGKTYFANDRKAVAESDSMERRIQDVIELSEYLAQRFDRPKIALLGGSWGSVLGINAAKLRPDLFSVYISNTQIANHDTALRMAYGKALELAEQADYRRDVRALQKLAPYPGEGTPATFDARTYFRWWRVQNITRKYESVPLSLHAGGMLEGLWPQCYSPYYSLREATYYIRNDLAMLTGEGLNPVAARYLFEEYDLRGLGLTYELPIILGGGELDWIAPPSLVAEVFADISAPYKSHHIYEGVGHGFRYDDFVAVMTQEAYPFALAGNGAG